MSTLTKPRFDKPKRNAKGIAKDGYQYLWGLGLDEEHVNVTGVCHPVMALKDVRRKAREAAALEKLGAGAFSVMFMPGMQFEDEGEAANHLFHVTLDDRLSEITLDDRCLCGNSPCFQLVDLLRERAKALEELAGRIESTVDWEYEHNLATRAPAESEASHE